VIANSLKLFYYRQMSNMRTHTKKIALLAVAAIALAACGGSSKNASNDSTPATRTKNGALPTQSCATGGACAVGDVGPGGGKVFYVAPSPFASMGSACGSTCTYLEAAPAGWITASTPAGQVNCVTPGTATVEPVCVWSGNKGSFIGKTLTAIGTGMTNTAQMIAQNSEAGKAGTVARAFQGGGKTDWYLPSKDELNQMYINRSIIEGLGSNAYWSSSEIINTNAWTQYFTLKFNNGVQTNGTKADPKYVRPVRAFSETTCATGGVCAVGDVGPGGGKVFYVAPSTFTSKGACGSTCKYLEAAPVGWITTSTPAGQVNCSVGTSAVDSEFPVTAGSSTTDPRCAWSGTNSPIQITGTAIGTGYANTLAMIAQDGTAGKAGTVARAFQGGGKTDWYLPSKDELNQMYIANTIIGGLASDYFWSSSENGVGVWDQYFGNGGQHGWGKETAGFYVRPVRAF